MLLLIFPALSLWLSCNCSSPAVLQSQPGCKGNLYQQAVQNGQTLISYAHAEYIIQIILYIQSLRREKNMLYKRKNKITLSGMKYLLLSYNSFLSWFYISM